MIRVEALRKVGGYDPTIIAAEDDEVCFESAGGLEGLPDRLPR